MLIGFNSRKNKVDSQIKNLQQQKQYIIKMVVIGVIGVIFTICIAVYFIAAYYTRLSPIP